MIRPVSDRAQHATPEDWRILRGLAFYRLVLVTLELLLFEAGYFARFFDEVLPRWFYGTCVAYAACALALLLPIVYRRPPVRVQVHVHFLVDVAALTLLAYAAGGVPSGLGMLLLTPLVGCAMLLSRRMALMQSAVATLALLAEETVRQYATDAFDASPYTQTGILGLMIFATGLTANAVAWRARRSEELAAQSASDLASLARLNESVIEHMQTGVIVVENDGRIRLLNAAASQMLRARPGGSLALAAPQLAALLDDWRAGRPTGGSPVMPRPGAEELVPRFTRLGWGPQAPTLILVENARALRAQAQQMKLAALGRLSASIAHEIRNPLAAISHAGQLLAEAPDLSSENQRLLSMIQRQSIRLDKIVRDVLALSRRDTAGTEAIRLKAWLRQTVAQYAEAHPQSPRPVQLDDVADDVSVQFDPHHLQQVLFNLWDNSFVHGGRDGRRVKVRLTTGRLPNGAPWLEVLDNGPGIAAELLDRMFEPFFTTAHEGTGLGLFLARELCEYNHARLSYRTGRDGACFRILFSDAASQAGQAA